MNEFAKLEDALVLLGKGIDFPATPAIAARVRAELTTSSAAKSTDPRMPHFGRFALAALVGILLALVALFVFPDTRDAVAQFLGLNRLQIFYVTPTPPPTTAASTPAPTRSSAAAAPSSTTAARPTLTPRPTPTVQPFTQCCEVTLEKARESASFDLLVPSGQTPSKVYYQNIFADGEQVVMVFGDPAAPQYTLYQAQRWVYGKLIGKAVGPQTVIGEAQVNGTRALWFSGASHVVMVLDRTGQPIYNTERTVDANTLVWETGDPDLGTIYRIETKESLEDTVTFAESLGE